MNPIDQDNFITNKTQSIAIPQNEASNEYPDDCGSECSYCSSSYEMPEGSPAFESVLTEFAAKLESNRTLGSIDQFDESIYKWVPDDTEAPDRKTQVRFIEDAGNADEENSNAEDADEPTDNPRGRAQSMGSSSKPPRPDLTRSNSHLSPIIRRGKLNKFPLRKHPSSCSSTPINSPLLPRNKSTRVRPKSTIVRESQHHFKYVFQTINMSVSHEDLVMEKRNRADENRSMFDNISPSNSDILMY